MWTPLYDFGLLVRRRLAGRRRCAGRVALVVATIVACPATLPQAAASDGALNEARVTVEVLKAATSFSSGSAAVAGVRFRCPADSDFANLYVLVSQTVGGEVSRGWIQRPVECSGGESRLRVPVVPEAGVFDEGARALVTAELEACAGDGCESSDASRTPRLGEGGRGEPVYDGIDLQYTLPRLGAILAAGAGAEVRVSYQCRGGLTGVLYATLAQRQGDGVETGSDRKVVRCAEDRSGVLVFHASTTPWTPGSAFLVVESEICAVECVSGIAYRGVQLR